MSGIMYVTQSKFKTATEALKEGIDGVSKALNKTRLELLQKLGVLEKNLQDVSADLKTEIAMSTESVRNDLANVSTDVRGVNTIVTGLESKLGTIEGGVGDLRTALEKANRGIHLLCHVVAESYRGANGQKNERWYSDLLTFTKTSQENPSGDPLKQIKQNGEGPVMRLISSSSLGGNADNGGGLSSFRETLTRQLSGVLDST
jgi:archaellum component FlaC